MKPKAKDLQLPMDSEIRARLVADLRAYACGDRTCGAARCEAMRRAADVIENDGKWLTNALDDISDFADYMLLQQACGVVAHTELKKVIDKHRAPKSEAQP